MPICKRQIGSPATMALAVLMMLAGVIMLWGCGKKGPPEPPAGSRPPRVVDLAYGISGNTLELSWSKPEPNEEARLPVIGFLIYGSQRAMSEEACPNCPILFKIIGDVPVREAGTDQTGKPAIRFTEIIETGYRYIYKVHGYSKDGIRSKASNIVEFTF